MWCQSLKTMIPRPPHLVVGTPGSGHRHFENVHDLCHHLTVAHFPPRWIYHKLLQGKDGKSKPTTKSIWLTNHSFVGVSGMFAKKYHNIFQKKNSKSVNQCHYIQLVISLFLRKHHF